MLMKQNVNTDARRDSPVQVYEVIQKSSPQTMSEAWFRLATETEAETEMETRNSIQTL